MPKILSEQISRDEEIESMLGRWKYVEDLKNAIGKAISDLSTAQAMYNSPQMDNSHGRKSIEKIKEVRKDLVIALGKEQSK